MKRDTLQGEASELDSGVLGLLLGFLQRLSAEV